MAEHLKPGKETDEGRRKFVTGLLGLGFLSIFASIASLVKSIVPPKSAKSGYFPTVATGDVLVYAGGEKKNRPILAEELQVGDGFLAYPQGKGENQANLIIVARLHPEEFKPPTNLEWVVDGIVAYSALCTHLSCTVSWDKKPEEQASEIQCFCHNTVFDPRRGAKILAGPAPLPLPQLPLGVDDAGQLIAKGTFNGPVGPQA
jgi:rieske iron-sulfur protein